MRYKKEHLQLIMYEQFVWRIVIDFEAKIEFVF